MFRVRLAREQTSWVLALAGCSALMLTGCSSPAQPAPVVAQVPSTTAAPSVTLEPPVAALAPVTTTVEVTTTTTAAATTTLTDVHYEKNESYYFTSPGGGFQCGIIKLPTRVEAGCEGTTSPIPPRPADCMVNWGNGIRVTDTGVGAFMCSGGEVYTSGGSGPDPILPAGQSLSKLGFTCTTTATDVSCVNDQTAHGFSVAGKSNEVF